jgi:recombination protein RecR
VFEGVIQDLIDELGRLPGIGPKSAQRLAFHILSMETADVTRIARTLEEVKERARFCEICGNLSESEQCRICRDPRRDESILCVVEEAKDVLAIEKTRAFRGRYHVLGGALNPIENIGPGELRIRELLQRLQNPGITEIIIATDPNMEGEATATYLVRQLSPLGVKVTKLATGVQLGGDLEYVDEVTLGRAIEGRRNQVTE